MYIYIYIETCIMAFVSSRVYIRMFKETMEDAFVFRGTSSDIHALTIAILLRPSSVSWMFKCCTLHVYICILYVRWAREYWAQSVVEHPAVENKGGLPLLRDARRCTMLMLIRSRSKFMVVDSENNTNASPTKHNVINIRYFYILNNYLYPI